jgi:hypothetical protein
MSDQNKCRVIGLKDTGEQIAITVYISRELAEQVIALIGGFSAFARLSIECEDA